MYTVYAIYNPDCKKYYVGQTINIESRLQQHNQKMYPGYTSRFVGKWFVIYSEEVKTRSEALLREKQLKSYQGREFVKKHIPR